MKKKFIAVGGGGVLVLVAAFVTVSLMGVPAKKAELERQRGQESYYTGEAISRPLPDVVTNLKGTNGQGFLSLSSTVVYRLGEELDDAEPIFAARDPAIKDRLILILSDKTPADLEGFEKKSFLKEEIRRILNKVVFPEQRGRIEEVLFVDFKVQR